MGAQGKYRIFTFKEFVPDWLRFTILLLGIVVFQFSNSVYLTTLNEVVGGKALTGEDIRLMVAVSFVGMTMMFPILMRIKNAFTSRTILLSASLFVVLGNIICMYSNNMSVLLVTSLIVGAAKCIGTFECASTLFPKITPTRDLTVFFPILFFVFIASIQLSGLLTAEISYLFNWQYMHILIVGLQLTFMVVVYRLIRPIRLMKRIPLYQIDWLGMGLWALVLLLINFIFEYGVRLDWLDSGYIKLAIAATVFFLICAIVRMFTIRRPIIMPEVFKYKNVWIALGLLVLLQIFLSTSSVIMNVYTGGILHYDILHNASLNWMVFLGVLAGTIFIYYWKSIYKGSYSTVFFIGFLALVLHHFILYFVFQPGIAKEELYLPYALRGFGHIVLFIAIALYAADKVIVPHFFASLCVLGFVRTAIGGTMANSVCTNILQFLQNKNLMILSQEMDIVDPTTSYLFQNTLNRSLSSGMAIEQAQIAATNTLYGATNMQAMMLSWKEIFGGITLIGIIILLAIPGIRYFKWYLAVMRS
jgi:MFS family permease